MARCELVLFDLDDTLFDHRGAASDAVAAWLDALGVQPSGELVELWFDAESRHVAAWHRGELDWQGQRRARVTEMLLALGLPAGGQAAIDSSFAWYLSAYERGWRAFDDVTPVLELLEREGVDVAVLSNGADAQQRQKLAAIGLGDRIGQVFCSDVIGCAKPDARAFRHVCEQLDRDPAVVVSVGDRHDLDVLAARAAGLRAVHLDRHGTGRGGEPSRIATMAELPRYL